MGNGSSMRSSGRGWAEKQGLLDPHCLLSFSPNRITPTAWLSLHVEILLPGKDRRGMMG